VFGTRPEAIKMAPVVAKLAKRSDRVQSSVCVTAQHREMLDEVLSVFRIVPDHDLNVMQTNQSLCMLTGEIVVKLEPVLLKEKPDWVLVQGDTTTALVAALVAYYHRVPVAHVEAGLRTQDKYRPFPEEINRRAADMVSSLHFAPTVAARDNLLREGIGEATIHVTGNTVIDALLEVVEKPCRFAGALARAPWHRRVVLVTAHRRESFGKPLEEICRALIRISDSHDDVHIIIPVHPNPNVRALVHSMLAGRERISLLEPLDYLTFAHVMKRSFLVLTDSGGIQEEAPALGKPVLVMREKTERPEAIEAGTARLVGTSCERIVSEVGRLLDDRALYEKMARATNPYGDGHASERIVDVLLKQGGGGPGGG
jgi:UDP-N-acetylglucosamine 2-epimerase (non-hydrolysing)